MKISGSDPVRFHAKHVFASDRHAEARDHERSLERSERDRRVRPHDTTDRVTFGEYLRRENLETPDEVVSVGSDVERSEGRLAAPKIGDVFPLDADKDAACDANGYDRNGRGVYKPATSGFTVRTLDVIA
ncbi:MAG: hypothetical protein RLN60_05100 [Phycisphaerales bacterium]